MNFTLCFLEMNANGTELEQLVHMHRTLGNLCNDDDEGNEKRQKSNRVFSHDVTAAILASRNNETEAKLVSQTNPLGVVLFSYANAFFCSNKFA